MQGRLLLWWVAVLTLALVCVGGSVDINFVSIFPQGAGGDRSALALTQAYNAAGLLGEHNHTVVRTVYPMPPSIDEYMPWLEIPGGGPDILPWYPAGSGDAVFSSEFYQDVSDIHAATGLDQDLPPAVAAAVRGADGGVYGVPLVGETFLCMYRRSMFESIGAVPPTHWSDLLALCAAAPALGIPYCLSTDFANIAPTAVLDYLIIRMHGNEVYNQFVDGALSFQDIRIKCSIVQFLSLRNAGYFVAKPDGKIPTALDLITNSTLITCGVAASFGSAVRGGVPASDIGTFEFPIYDGINATAGPDSSTDATLAITLMLSVPQSASNPDAARDFLTYVARADVMANVTLPSVLSSYTLRKSVSPSIKVPLAAFGYSLVASAQSSIRLTSRTAFAVPEITLAWAALLQSILTAPVPLTTHDIDTHLAALEILREEHVLGRTSAPYTTLDPGTYFGSQVTELVSQTPSSLIYYTTDGSPPSDSSTLYNTPIILSAGSVTIIRAIAQSRGLSASVEATFSYTIKAEARPPPVASGLSQAILLSILIPLAVAIIVFAAVAYFCHRRAVARSALKISAASDDMIINPGSITLSRKVGQGAFGAVYAGTWRSQPVAVKQIIDKALSQKRLSRFVNEAELLMRMRHTNIVLFYGVLVSPPSIVTEFMQRGSLYNILHDPDIQLHSSIITQWAYEMTRGLQFLEQSNVVHGDLKSLNVLLDQQWVAKLADFGMSVLQSTTYNGATATGFEQVGTLFWAAPELIDQGRVALSSASDAYALGITMWEMVSRSRLYPGMTQAQVALRVMKGARPPTLELDPQLSHLTHLMRRLWHNIPHSRASFDDVIAVLEPIVNLSPIIHPSHLTDPHLTDAPYCVHVQLIDGVQELLLEPSSGELIISMFRNYARDLAAATGTHIASSTLCSFTLKFALITHLEDVIKSTTKVSHATDIGTRLRIIVAKGGLSDEASHQADCPFAKDVQAFLDSLDGPSFGMFVHSSAFDALETIFAVSPGRSRPDSTPNFEVTDDVCIRLNRPNEPKPSCLSRSPTLSWSWSSESHGHGKLPGAALSLISPDWVKKYTQGKDPSVGSMTNAYRAPHKGVLIKVLQNQTMPPTKIVRFVALLARAAKAHSIDPRLTGPSAVCIHPPFLAFTVPYFTSGSLADALARGTLTDPAHKKAVLLGIVRALGPLHSIELLGIPHGALKPSNVMLGQEPDDVHLVDFGLASLTDSMLSLSTTYRPFAHYTAPEILTSNLFTTAADVFIFATIAYEVVANELAFPIDASIHAIASALTDGRLPSLSPLAPDLASLLELCWDLDPSSRPAVADLGASLDALPVSAFSRQPTR